MPATAQQAFLQDPDQAARRQELATFFGPRPDKFLKVYDNMAAIANRAPGTRPKFTAFGNFCWPAFFLGPIWMFYRKMWVWASIVTAIFFIFSFLPIPRGAGIGLGAAIGSFGATLYVTQAISAVTRLRGKPSQIAAVGGVSPLAGWVAGIVYLAAVGSLSYHMAMYDRANRGSSPPASLTQPFPR